MKDKRGSFRANRKRRKRSLINKNGSVCALCGKHLEDDEITLDHIIPLRDGGSHKLENLQILCRGCNQKKG